MARRCAGPLSSNWRRVFQPNVINVRYLLPAEVTKYEHFKTQKYRTEEKLFGEIDTFHKAMDKKVKRDDVIFTDELKVMLHTCNSAEDAELAIQIMKMYHSKIRNAPFQQFRFGSIVMRMFHNLQLCDKMLDLLKDKELQGFFSDSTSFILAMDAYFESEQYNKVLEVYKEMELQNIMKLKDAYTLTLAACYRLNTTESYDLSQTILEECQIRDKGMTRLGYNFAAALAINQNNAERALTILSFVRNADHEICRSLQVIGLTMLERYTEAFQSLQSIYNRDVPVFVQKWKICQEALDALRSKVQENDEISSEFEEIYRCLETGEHICTETIENLLCAIPVVKMKKFNFDNRSNRRKSFKRVSPSLMEE
uniref:Pentatricopeptide repeat-containing protein 2, mitochondrial-like n=1 Tax=Saccoglossus kowalevskii TaxID=10224 RepID=A0ABM0GT22_SACKO|nr:PREDICTED: pentatricopeptide repeat-containing protein 2, mitochondrial-like [Saccoglossus kowalevskii]